MGEKEFEQKLEKFVNEYIAEKIHQIRQQNKDLIAKKAAVAEQLQSNEAFFVYEELETDYIILLTSGIYKQAMRDFYFFTNHYLK